MEVNEVLKISASALLHDIGKIIPRSEINSDYIKNNSPIYLPFNKKDKEFTHEHAVYTVYFIEKFLQDIAQQFNKISLSGAKSEDSFINLAGKHHKPETPLQWIVAEADRLSSGIDRKEFLMGKSISPKEYYKTRLLSVFERLLRTDKTFENLKDFEWEYPLVPLSANGIFPVQKKQKEEKEEKNFPKEKEEYTSLWKKFEEDIKKIKLNELSLWTRAFDSLLKIYTSQVPSARAGKVIPDISLYDHSRTTSAIAGVLYLYHSETNTLEIKAIQKEEEEKFLLISGDFYGIQDFIFKNGGEERHHRAKILRGRSFMVSLISELCAEFICEELGLSFLQIFFYAAGKFHLLAPNLPEIKEKLENLKERLVSWFKEKFYLESGIGIVYTPLSPTKFYPQNFINLWKEHLKRLEENKYKRFNLIKFGGRIKGYLEQFKMERPVCPLCGTRPSKVKKKEYFACEICEDQIYMGTNLVKSKSLAIFKNKNGDLKAPIFGVYQIKFLKNGKELEDNKNILKVIDFNLEEDGTCPIGNVYLPINGYVPVYSEEDNKDERILYGEKSEKKKLELIELIKEGAPKTFAHIAKKALKIENEKVYGLEALSVFKADIDNLGALFTCGLPEKLFTISRLCTMSRKLHEFFAIYIPYALSKEGNGKFKEVYTVFAGGDDLFLIGPWNVMPELALFLENKFKNYVCENSEIHFSAGITLHKPYVPIEHLVEEAEAYLKEAKRGGKAQVCMFEKVVKWEEFRELLSIENEFIKWYKKGLSKSFFYKLNEFITMAEELKFFINNGCLPVNKLSCVRWTALLSYFVFRNTKDRFSEEEKEEIIENCCRWIGEKFGGALKIPLWKFLYSIREARY